MVLGLDGSSKQLFGHGRDLRVLGDIDFLPDSPLAEPVLGVVRIEFFLPVNLGSLLLSLGHCLSLALLLVLRFLLLRLLLSLRPVLSLLPLRLLLFLLCMGRLEVVLWRVVIFLSGLFFFSVLHLHLRVLL